MNTPHLQQIADCLDHRLETTPSAPRLYPGRWVDPAGGPDAQSLIPEEFFSGCIAHILNTPHRARVTDGGQPGDWAKNAVVYNLLVRYGAAFDHNADGKLSVEADEEGWRETGTFLKAIAMLPYIQSLGVNTIHLLPITAIGRDGNKGDMGSAFAIRDPYELDEHLAEPALGLDVRTEFAAFVEATHHLGIRVVVEFVFRTAAKDSTWAKEHPEWFYWIRADIPDRQPGEATEEAYGAPLFTPEELHQIYDAVGNGRFHELLPPHDIYRRMFTLPPTPESVRLENGCWRGTAPDPQTGGPVDVRIPGAFCDWGPDSQQPPWTDVTYLRLYDHPDYNYIAYNTVRMYSAQLATEDNIVRPLWDKILEVIPHYQREYGIDGVMIDMGHALPGDLKRQMVDRARAVDSDFALWAEEFNLSPEARAEGYNLCVGPFMQTVRDTGRWRGWLEWLQQAGVPVPFMAMAENHNTPRANHWPGGNAYSLYAQTLGAFLPGAPYLHNGIELAETVPVNTGFDFSNEETAQWPPSKLPLFSAIAMDWTRKDTLVEAIRRMHKLRADYRDLCTCADPGTVFWQGTDNPAVMGYLRKNPATGRGLAVLGNTDMGNPQSFTPPLVEAPVDLLSGEALSGTLAPAQVVIYEI